MSLLYLRNGGVLVGRVGLEHMLVETRYGELRIPVEEIQQIRFARRIPEAEKERIQEAIDQLGDPDFDRRESAMQALRDIGSPARRFLRAALKAEDEEVKSRAESLLAEISEETEGETHLEDSIEPLRDAEDDEVITSRFTIRGRVVRDSYGVETSYGELSVARADMIGILLDPEMSISKRVTVPATTLVPGKWLDTRLSFTAGRRIRFEASGQLFVANYNLRCGPEGTTRYSGSTFNNLPMLSLVGKIGKRGKPFLVGQSSSTRARKQGRLYLGIVPFRRNYAATGQYKVKIESER